MNEGPFSQDRRILCLEGIDDPAIVGRWFLVNLVDTKEATKADESRPVYQRVSPHKQQTSGIKGTYEIDPPSKSILCTEEPDKDETQLAPVH